MEIKKRDTQQEKRECFECWRRRFRKEMTAAAQLLKTELPVAFESLISKREKEEKEVREKLISVRDEIHELRLLAGDHYLGRYSDDEKK